MLSNTDYALCNPPDSHSQLAISFFIKPKPGLWLILYKYQTRLNPIRKSNISQIDKLLKIRYDFKAKSLKIFLLFFFKLLRLNIVSSFFKVDKSFLSVEYFFLQYKSVSLRLF